MLACKKLSKNSAISHGFFTRNGGKSAGLYASLNCAFGSGDDKDIVAQNRAIVTQALGQKTDSLSTCYQIHSATAVILEKPWTQDQAPQADALVTATPGITLGILTADCLPILFADSSKNIIAAAHAGWKGAFGGVIEATVTAMQKLGADIAKIHAVIGPGIAQSSYEVGQEFFDRFIAQDAKNEAYFIPHAKPAHYGFDLKAYASARLTQTGVNSINLLAHDTCLDENQFFSYRRSCLRSESVYGRQISAIALKK